MIQFASAILLCPRFSSLPPFPLLPPSSSLGNLRAHLREAPSVFQRWREDIPGACQPVRYLPRLSALPHTPSYPPFVPRGENFPLIWLFATWGEGGGMQFLFWKPIEMHLGGCVEAERASECKLAWSDGGRERGLASQLSRIDIRQLGLVNYRCIYKRALAPTL